MSNVRQFGAAGDGVADDTNAIQHTVDQGDGLLEFPPGAYRITRPIEVRLETAGPFSIDGTGCTARVIMAGPGPAFRLIGTHRGTADPSLVVGNVFPEQRLPTVRNIEIEGTHSEADGIQLVRTMQATLNGVQIRECRHGIHLTQRNRNVVISDCQIYHNRGVGVFLDEVNLHQINMVGNHISYNRLGGIRIERSEVRNLQITGNDIEYNNHAQHDSDPEPTAEIFVDTSAPGASVNEVTIASNTIQATVSAGGSNIRIIGPADRSQRPPGLWAITGNIIGSQENNIHLTDCYGISLSGNCIYSCANRNLLIEKSQLITLGSNVFRRHTPTLATGVRIANSADIVFNGCAILDEHPEGQSTGASLMELTNCRRVNISGSQFLNGVPCGIDAIDCSHVVVAACTIHDTRPRTQSRHAIRIHGQGQGNLLSSNSTGATTDVALAIADAAGVTLQGNLVGSY